MYKFSPDTEIKERKAQELRLLGASESVIQHALQVMDDVYQMGYDNGHEDGYDKGYDQGRANWE
jgi:flagellar biosynthesis/type III secretory pathway protein FliH